MFLHSLTLSSKIRFSSVLDRFSSVPLETMLTFLFPRLHGPQNLRNIKLRGRGIGDLTLDANKLEQKYGKAFFPKGVSTTFVANCSLIIYESPMWSQSIVHLIKS